jgi:hypothetical protein
VYEADLALVHELVQVLERRQAVHLASRLGQRVHEPDQVAERLLGVM